MLARNLARSNLISRASGSTCTTSLCSTPSCSASLAVRFLSTGAQTSVPRAAISVRRLTTQEALRTNSLGPRQLHVSAVRSEAGKDRSWVNKGEVTYSELKPETQAPSGNITIIDVREPDEVAQGIIPSAVNVPLSQFKKAFASTGTGGNFVRDFGFDRPQFDQQLVFYCRSGKRSQQALEYAQAQGWWNSRNYTGSWLDWTAHEEKK
ncbi:hypothetical protein OC845_001356 [Tilletia horrida]|nr:hypothetical protein OC845_001356 [Tilletia horrida]